MIDKSHAKIIIEQQINDMDLLSLDKDNLNYDKMIEIFIASSGDDIDKALHAIYSVYPELNC